MYKIAGMWGLLTLRPVVTPVDSHPQKLIEMDPGIDFLDSVTLSISCRVMAIYH